MRSYGQVSSYTGENNDFEFVFLAFALFFQLKSSITKFKSEKWRRKLEKVNNKLL